MKRSFVAACFVVACGHDEQSLAPDALRDIPAWLNVPDGSLCDLCMSSSCLVSSMACLENAACRTNVAQCMPPNPGCAQIDYLTREAATCLSKACKSECDLLPHATDCIGQYIWRAPIAPGPVTYEIRASVFQDVVFSSELNVATCWGPTPMCDEASAVRLPIGQLANNHYMHTVAAARPYFHLTGEGVRPMLFYEDANISSGYQINFLVVPESLYQVLVSLFKVPADPALGTLNAKVFDCKGEGLAGVELRLERDGKQLSGEQIGAQYYFDAKVPQPVSIRASTSSDGLGGFLNVAPGVYNLRAYLGDELVATIDSVIVQRGEVTHVNLMPRSQDESSSAAP